MNKSTALQLFDGTVKGLADACHISSSAISQWPEELTKDQTDRVQAALYRRGQTKVAPKIPATAEQGTSHA